MDSPNQAHMGFRNYRWVICALLFFGTTIHYLDRQIHSLTGPVLNKLLTWTNTKRGCVNTELLL